MLGREEITMIVGCNSIYSSKNIINARTHWFEQNTTQEDKDDYAFRTGLSRTKGGIGNPAITTIESRVMAQNLLQSQ